MEKQGGTEKSQQLGNPTIQKHMEWSKHTICAASGNGQPWSQQAPKGYVHRPKHARAATSESGIARASLSLSKSTMAKVHWQKGFHWQERSWKDYKMEQEWGKKDFHQFYMA